MDIGKCDTNDVVAELFGHDSYLLSNDFKRGKESKTEKLKCGQFTRVQTTASSLSMKAVADICLGQVPKQLDNSILAKGTTI